MKNLHRNENELCMGSPVTIFGRKNTRVGDLSQTRKLRDVLSRCDLWGRTRMINDLNDDLNENVKSNELQTKDNFATVSSEKLKPESRNSGFDNNNRDLRHKSANDELPNNSIIAEVPNFYKQYGTTVENSGYFSFPRSISTDPRYKGARLKYKHVLHTILENAVFRKTTHSIGTNVIDIEVGQFCVSERKLVDLCNEGLRYKEDFVDKNTVHRAVHFWRTCGFVNQEVIHEKNLLTVTVPEFYTKDKNTSEPESEPKVNHNRTSKETLETLETLNISSVADAPSEKKKVSSSSSKKRKKTEPVPLVERDKGVFVSDIAHQKLIEQKGSEEIVKQIYSAMSVWKAQNGIAGGDDYRTAIKWTLNTAKTNAVSYNKPPSKHNNPNFKPKVETPLAYNNRLSFNTEKNK